MLRPQTGSYIAPQQPLDWPGRVSYSSGLRDAFNLIRSPDPSGHSQQIEPARIRRARVGNDRRVHPADVLVAQTPRTNDAVRHHHQTCQARIQLGN